MKHLFTALILVLLIAFPVNATEYTAPEVPADIMPIMPDETESFGQGILYVIKSALQSISPSISASAKICLSLCAISLLVGMAENYFKDASVTINLVGALASGVLLFGPSNTLIKQSIDTVLQIQQYGKLLFPALSAALTAQGAPVTAAAVHTGTLFFTTLLISLITSVIVPVLYAYLCLCIVSAALDQQIIVRLKKSLKGFVSWCLKTVLYVFTGYMTITRAVSGTTDATALKATRITISGVVPVVGRILSDASEAVLVGAGLVKNSIGVYGLIAVFAIGITPFLCAGVYYLLLKLCCVICSVWGTGKHTALITDISSVMGYVLAITATVCIMLFIGIVCFMKGLRS